MSYYMIKSKHLQDKVVHLFYLELIKLNFKLLEFILVEIINITLELILISFHLKDYKNSFGKIMIKKFIITLFIP